MAVVLLDGKSNNDEQKQKKHPQLWVFFMTNNRGILWDIVPADLYCGLNYNVYVLNDTYYANTSKRRKKWVHLHIMY